MLNKLEGLRFNDEGLIPAIVQDQRTGDVLMLAYMNEEAIQQTIETGETWFYSRSRQKLWNKGATSGNRQYVKSLSLDCDKDTILIQVEPLGPACHTGEETCFFTPVSREFKSRNILLELSDEIQSRRQNPLEGSYTSYLFREGIDKVCKKIGEEATEVVIAAKNGDPTELKNELADLVYHAMVLMDIVGVTTDDVVHVLRERRMKKEVPAND
ncbi:bifunctional phosphoribosyl-AMP cyclohydrolase/phosphoribosyl-ATP diphosphatase HisIE [Sporosarcina sp. Te-1]|uniref:bifunctional phosphoribosyl-AMP cyclohydrolase/phosphoribosyl-ATP diphosphatase HisIE n=1 Tax=Sporosarcina sp. Te-1 TaxID=2818390 RepID=UPI001A9FEEB6|nr:bifunctional phosphoribosyl-AMP cyclohydrolase/phosphoribosyl-ATP diphosphatase HisIE [Sporosarcina sp. Te-1]QTD41309.1 bifunctional phosphoribosyl-AMP cyclohydrolase/phosphoribosyl-ATP diphosphatase HisIE [Sporosarcina sp. Te-1]